MTEKYYQVEMVRDRNSYTPKTIREIRQMRKLEGLEELIREQMERKIRQGSDWARTTIIIN